MRLDPASLSNCYCDKRTRSHLRSAEAASNEGSKSPEKSVVFWFTSLSPSNPSAPTSALTSTRYLQTTLVDHPSNEPCRGAKQQPMGP